MLFAPVNRIIPFSNVDGPGNRMAIFLQSCPFQCWYCHNPETINMCIHCGICVPGCPSKALTMTDGKVHWDESLCEQCDSCIKICPHLASPKILTMSSDDVIEKLKEVAPFVRGITVSGGECMMHPEFLEELFGKVKALNMTSLIDSNGFVRFEEYPGLMGVCDGVMLDVKATDPRFHQQLTTHDNASVMDNLHYLLSVNKLTEVRIVCLPRFDEQNRKTIEDVVSIVKDQARIKLIRYRPYGVRQEGLDILGSASLNEELFLEYKRYAQSLGAGNVVSV